MRAPLRRDHVKLSTVLLAGLAATPLWTMACSSTPERPAAVAPDTGPAAGADLHCQCGSSP